MSKAYEEYMKMADALFERLRNGTIETSEEVKQIKEKQDILWNQMSDEEKMDADEQVLSTVIRIQATKNNFRHRRA